jgi:hypothetical protein
MVIDIDLISSDMVMCAASAADLHRGVQEWSMYMWADDEEIMEVRRQDGDVRHNLQGTPVVTRCCVSCLLPSSTLACSWKETLSGGIRMR